MKKRLFSFLFSFVIFVSCSDRLNVGDSYVATDDLPAAKNTHYAEEIDKYIKKHDNESAMRMFYLGYSELVTSGTTINILAKKNEYVYFKAGEKYLWTKDTYLKNNTKKK